ILGKLMPENEKQMAMCRRVGISDIDRVLSQDDLILKDDVFFAATAITDFELLKGVTYKDNSASTHSVVMRSTNGIIRFVDASHKLDRSMININDEINFS
ncbi:MAG TPA: fructose-bisphosphatase class II, partial [Clostridiaceae bacterium]|nr:fructose-bisphosphatase class II [Clostridiaceae bacterium]